MWQISYGTHAKYDRILTVCQHKNDTTHSNTRQKIAHIELQKH